MLDIHFAPLQGFTECAYRQAHFLFVSNANASSGIGKITAYYTPFLRVEKGTVREKDLRDLQQDLDFINNHEGYNVIPQIICKDVSEFKILVNAIEALNKKSLEAGGKTFQQIDINMGCPFPMQAKAGRGSGLLPHIDAVKEILQEVSLHSRPKRHSELVSGTALKADAERPQQDLMFSVKMRLGYTDSAESLALLPLLNAAPLTHITLHPRLGIQQYKGALDFQSFQTFVEGCLHPVIFNGDITSLKDKAVIEKQFPQLKGIMIGRGFLANPTLGVPYPIKTLLDIHDYVLEDYRKRLQGDAQVLDKIRPFWTYPAEATQKDSSVASALPKRMLKGISKARNLDEYCKILQDFRQTL